MAVWSCWIRGVLFPWLWHEWVSCIEYCICIYLHDKGTSCQEASRNGEQSNYWICNSRNRCTNRGTSRPVVLIHPFNTSRLILYHVYLLTSAVIYVSESICKKRQMKSRRVNEVHKLQASWYDWMKIPIWTLWRSFFFIFNPFHEILKLNSFTTHIHTHTHHVSFYQTS